MKSDKMRTDTAGGTGPGGTYPCIDLRTIYGMPTWGALEKGMIVLSTAVAGGPFIGLLGTVWGVMDTFTGVALAGSASLQAMAPGVSGALVTTVTGLLVAIPAMFGYNFLVTSIRSLIVQSDNFAAELASEIEHRYVNHGSRSVFAK